MDQSGTSYHKGEASLKIAIVWSLGGPTFWSDEDLEAGIGGSEVMMILRARALAKLGHDVTCFAPGNEREHVECGVTWRSLPFWPTHGAAYDFGNEGFDVLVSLRRAGWGDAYLPPVRALWGNDQSVYDLEESVANGSCNLVITISEYQKELFQRKYSTVPEYMYLVSSGGLEFADYTPARDKNMKLCMYSSTPERGLRQLIVSWRDIVKQVPDAQLVVTGGFELYGATPRKALDLSEGLYGTVSYMPNASYTSVLPRSALIELQQRAAMLIYPSIYDEMCCIVALEMHAAGCAIVTTDRAALSERVRDGVDGYLIPGSPGTPAYDEFFVERVVELLNDPDKCCKMGAAGREVVRAYDHTVLAKQWIERFEHILRGRN